MQVKWKLLALLCLCALLGAGIILLDFSSITGQASPTPTPSGTSIQQGDDRPDGIRLLTSGWKTNWSKRTISASELLGGGPARDGIPSIDAPQFVTIDKAAEWLKDNEPVIVLQVNGEARAYPLQILVWHEIVNDTIGGVPVIVTFCPLCNAAIVFDRRVNGQTYTFGVSGLLRKSDMIMYDRTTETLWQQFTGEAVIGDLTGAQLKLLSSSMVGFADFRAAYKNGRVLSRETGFARSYGQNPYVGYDDIKQPPFLYDGKTDDRLLAMERVITVFIGGMDVAYPYSITRREGVIYDNPNGVDLVMFHIGGTASALDRAQIAEGVDVGATGVFDPRVDGKKLTFRLEGKTFIDAETNSTWNILGQAVSGPMVGKQLTPILHANHFWFAWAAFKPQTIIYKGKP